MIFYDASILGDIKNPVPFTSVKNGELIRILKDSLKIFYLTSISKIGQQECAARETIEGILVATSTIFNL